MEDEGARHGPRRLEYDAIVLGEEIGPLEIVVDERRVRSFAYAVDDFNPWYLWDSPFRGSALAAESRRLRVRGRVGAEVRPGERPSAGGESRVALG